MPAIQRLEGEEGRLFEHCPLPFFVTNFPSIIPKLFAMMLTQNDRKLDTDSQVYSLENL